MNKLQQNEMKPNGFTLLELLMVVTIIGLLMSMSVVVMYGFIDQAEEEATSATIQKINRLLEQRIEAFDRAFKGSMQSRYEVAMRMLLTKHEMLFPSATFTVADSERIYTSREAVVTILAKKTAFRHMFPQRHEDLLWLSFPVGSSPIYGDYNTATDFNSDGLTLKTVPNRLIDLNGNNVADYLETQTGYNPSLDDPSTVSSELLYYTLITSGTLGAAAVDTDRFTNAEVRDTDADGLPEFVDAWGQPLRYYRWPTRLIDVNPPVPFQPVLDNPNDNTDVLVNVDTDNDGTPDTIIGQRTITQAERDVANLLLKGLPPAPSVLPNNAMPRDLLLIDPDDPVGRLYAELENLNGTNGKPTLALEFNEAKYHTPDTFHAPLVVSAGADGVLGLYEPNDTANFGNLAAYDSTLTLAQMIDAISDNITSRNKMSGGR